MKKTDYTKILIFISLLVLVLTGCARGMAHEAEFTSSYGNNEIENENIYVSFAQGIYKGCNRETGEFYFYRLGSGEEVTLLFDGTTTINDKYGQPMSIEMLRPSDIINIAYSAELQKAGAIVITPEVLTISNISKYAVDESGQSIVVGDETFFFDANAVLFSNGFELTPNQLISKDVITINTIDRKVYSLIVDDGHGYLQLTNEDSLIGGWIEIGNQVISQVMSDMMITVPEGTYNVRLTNTGIEEYREVTIRRNEVTSLDLGDIVSSVPEKGIVSFSITPQNAIAYLDGSYIDHTMKMKIPVGVHEITVSASGYSTVTQYFEVTGINQNVEVDLENETTISTVSGNTVNKNLYATVTIESPVDAEVYEDNIYKGITPSSYQKTPGTHTITLHKNGYVTVSYTIYVEDDGLDQSFSFPELVPERSDVTYDANGNPINNTNTVSGNNINNGNGGNNTVSGNTISGNTISGNSVPTPTPSPTAEP